MSVEISDSLLKDLGIDKTHIEEVFKKKKQDYYEEKENITHYIRVTPSILMIMIFRGSWSYQLALLEDADIPYGNN